MNSRLTYQANENLSVSAWVKNLTNKYYYTYGLNIDVFGLDYLNRGPCAPTASKRPSNSDRRRHGDRRAPLL